MVERLCARYGDFLGSVGGADFYTFPELDRLCAATVRRASCCPRHCAVR